MHSAHLQHPTTPFLSYGNQSEKVIFLFIKVITYLKQHSEKNLEERGKTTIFEK